MSKHTKGPWIFREYLGDEEHIALLRENGREPVLAMGNNGERYINNGETRICTVDVQSKFKRGEGHKAVCSERDANARLISASPDLLAALKACVAKWVELVESGDAGFWDAEKDAHVIAARAAISKAEGQ